MAISQMQVTRRNFLKFLGLSTVLLSSCKHEAIEELVSTSPNILNGISATTEDSFVLPQGIEYKIIRSWKDSINASELFGTNNDFTCFFQNGPDSALLWVNHETLDPQLIPDIEEQRKSVGGSVIGLKKEAGEWSFDPDNKLNRRYDANTKFSVTGPLASKKTSIIGTLANCSGGKTPWNTVLSCEENYHYFDSKYGWKDFDREDYGWVIEVNPFDPARTPLKHSALGHFSHENAALTQAASGQLVVYMGDDKADEHIYKFISKESDIKLGSKLLEEGTLYVAKLSKKKNTGKWLELSISNPKLKEHFKDQTDLLINTRKAAKLLKATPLDRPEDLEVSPFDSSIFVALTKNPDHEIEHGSILKITEKDHADLKFKFEDFVVGGEEAGISCPDNLCFDDKTNLWVCTDISGNQLGKKPYKYHGNNSLFVIPTQGKDAGKAVRVASAPIGAELTGPSFSDDYKTLFLSIQHPGEEGKGSWNSKDAVPRSAVVAINLSK